MNINVLPEKQESIVIKVDKIQSFNSHFQQNLRNHEF